MEYRLNKIDSPVYVKRLFFLCWLVYCTSYLGRLNYSAAMTVMIKENVLDSSQAGFISMLYFFAYGI
ncbi:MAG TPA: MFS transporter, partial [Lachnoclostridium phytofermentans]|nr:MFS transporter [Lachnoclostridium phytofermentans]